MDECKPLGEGGRAQRGAPQGRVVQVDPIKPKLKPPGTKRLKLNCDVLLSTSAFKFNLRRYIKLTADVADSSNAVKMFVIKVRRCRLTLSNPT